MQNISTKLILLLSAALLFPIKLYAEETAEKDPWKSSVGISYVTISGNSDAQTLSISADAIWRIDGSELELKAETVYGKSEGEKVSEYWNLKGKYNRNISKKAYLFGLVSMEGNELAGFHWRLSAYPGVGYRFLENRHELKGEIGPGYVFEDRIEDADLSYPSGRVYAKYLFHITKDSYFSQEAEYLHDFHEADNFRVNADTSLVVKLNKWISFKTGVTVHYVNLPPEETEDTDVFTGTSLVFTF